MIEKSVLFRPSWVLTALLFTSLASCAAPQPTARVTSSGGPGMGQAQAIPYDGPRARIAVISFENKAARGRQAYYAYDEKIGYGMADMLTTELFHTNRFIVLERAQLGDVLTEQDLAASGRIKPGTEATMGQIEGAELLVTGAITEFEPNAGGAGVGVIFGGLPIGLGGGGKRAHIAIDMRVIDAKTSRILAATTVEGSATDIGGMGGFVVGGGMTELGVGLGGFAKTPMEKAVRIVLREAVNYIASQTPAQYFHQ
jgi:curli biogenesis system outer membrane secretion channel CsgG